MGFENESEQSFECPHIMIAEQSQSGYELTSSLAPTEVFSARIEFVWFFGFSSSQYPSVRQRQCPHLRASSETRCRPSICVHDDAETTIERNLHSGLAASLRHTHRPCLQPKPTRRALKQDVGGFVERRANHRVAESEDSFRAFDLSRLPFARRKPEVRAHRARTRKTRWHVDARPEGQRRHRTHVGYRHQATADQVGSHRLQHHPVQPDVFRQQRRASPQHRLHQTRQRRTLRDQSEDPRLQPATGDLAHLQSEVAQRTPDVSLGVAQLLQHEPAVGKEHSFFLARYRLHVYWTNQVRANQLGGSARVIAVALVHRGREHRLELLRLGANHRETGLASIIKQRNICYTRDSSGANPITPSFGTN